MESMRSVLSRIQQTVFCVLVVAGCATVAGAQVHNNGTGTDHGYFYSLYSSGGSATMTSKCRDSPATTPLPGLALRMWSAAKAGTPAALRPLATMLAPPAAITTSRSTAGSTNPLVEYYICETGFTLHGKCTIQGQCLQRWPQLQHV